MSAVSILRNPKGIVGVLLVLAGIVGLVILAVMLIGTKNDLKSTQANLDETTLLQEQTKESLDQTTATLQYTRETLSTTETALATTEDTLDDTTASLDRTETTLATTEDALASSQGREALLQEETAILSGELMETTDRLENVIQINAQKQRDLDRTRRQVADLTVEAEGLAADKAQLESDLATSESTYRVLEASAGTHTMLEAQAEALESDIAALHEERAPLIIASGDVEFTCTGSMEPNFTCLDTATVLYNYRPQDVVRGATIAFNPNCWEQDEPDSIATHHRVIDIKQENGTYYYWPRGDGNTEDDGCWVPDTNVISYIIEVHKNTLPENAALRDGVNAAEAALNEAENAYLELREKVCPMTGPCTVPTHTYNQLQALRAPYLAAYDLYWNCWFKNALESEYPGHIPYSC